MCCRGPSDLCLADPFESLTHEMDKAHLIRFNMSDANVPWEIRDKSVSLEEDLGKVLEDLRKDVNQSIH
jgi:hypothetical protein